MSKIRETLITNCEKKFLAKCLADYTRLDTRSFDEFRPLQIKFGKDWGSCYVALGKTRVLAQTSCEVVTPKSSRPSEGILNLNIELNPLAAPHFEAGRQSDLSVQLNRLLEKCIKDSKAVDLESLCIKTKEKVWALRVDINVINHEGNILDCASIAALTSLAHFRRPDVTCDGEDFVVHSHHQRDPITTVIHHYPICISYSIFNGGEFVLADSSLLEEGSADAILTVGLNGFKELCGLHLVGKAELTPTVILSVVGKATRRATTVIEEIKNSIKIDTEARLKKEVLGFHEEMKSFNLTNSTGVESSIDHWKTVKSKKTKQQKETFEEPKIEEIDQGSAAYIAENEEIVKIDDSDDDLMIIEAPKTQIQLDTDSEEDNVVTISGEFKK